MRICTNSIKDETRTYRASELEVGVFYKATVGLASAVIVDKYKKHLVWFYKSTGMVYVTKVMDSPATRFIRLPDSFSLTMENS